MIPDEVIIRAGTNMLAHTDMVPLEYVRQLEHGLAELSGQAEYVAHKLDYFAHRLCDNNERLGGLIDVCAKQLHHAVSDALRGE